MLEGLFLIVPMGIGTGICIGLIIGERHSRRTGREEMICERQQLQDAMKKISETHNQIAVTQKMQGELMEDLNQKVTFMVQGVKGK